MFVLTEFLPSRGAESPLDLKNILNFHYLQQEKKIFNTRYEVKETWFTGLKKWGILRYIKEPCILKSWKSSGIQNEISALLRLKLLEMCLSSSPELNVSYISGRIHITLLSWPYMCLWWCQVFLLFSPLMKYRCNSLC